MATPFNTTNRGKFHIASNVLMYGDLEDFAEIFSLLKFIPTKVEHDYMLDRFEYVGFSPLFDSVSAGTATPTYDVTVTMTMDHETNSNKFEVALSRV
jgi:hypothetical protein